MSLSIVVPAFNEESFIGETIQRMINVIGNLFVYEIIVVDNASTDATPAILNKFPQVYKIRLNTKVTVSAARNLGWKSAKFPLVAFIDGDMLLTSTWVDTFLQIKCSLEENPFQIAGCRVSLSENPSWLEQTWFGNMKANISQKYINSGNLITTALTMEKLNGFDENLITGEDVDFCIRGTNLGAGLLIDNNLVAHHEGYPKNIARFFKRERWHGIGDLKSVSTFLNSKVAIFSFAISILSVFFLLALILNAWPVVVVCLVLVIMMNGYAVYTRFTVRHIKTAINLFYLHLLYAFARFLSIFYRKEI